MRLITTSKELKAAILELELKKTEDLLLLKEQYYKTKEDFKPINLIKGTLKNAMSSPDIKSDAVNAVIGFTSGVIAKKLAIGKTINPFKKILGVVLEMTVANKVAKNADGIKSVGGNLLNLLFKKKKSHGDN